MNKQENKKPIVIAAIILIALVVLSVYYLLPDNIGQDPAEDYFTLTVMSDDITEEKAEEYRQQLLALKEVIEESPDYVNSWFDVGLIKKQVGDYRGAEAAWVKAGEIRPANSTSFGNLADLYANFLHEYDKAEAAYKVAIINSVNEAKNVLFYRQYAEFAFYRLESPEKTESILLEAAENNSGSSEPLILLANYYQGRGDAEKAIDYYEQALEIDPEDELVQDELDKLR